MRVLEKDDVKYYVREYPLDDIAINRLNLMDGINKRGDIYLTTFAAFDIETTVIEYNGESNSIMYIWQFAINTIDNDIDVYVGRSWIDYQKFLDVLTADIEGILCIYVHNLAYEFEFLQSVVDIDSVFALKKHAPVKVRSGAVEYRCSYRLSNMSLARFVESENVSLLKQKGYDYRKKRYPDTYLDDSELLYSVADVISLVMAIKKRLNHDNIVTIPITSTGYVRRDARKAVQKNEKNRLLMQDSRLSSHEYNLCKAAARGGNTHANYLYIGEILLDINSYDKKSSYPYQMLSKKYPVGRYIQERKENRIRDGMSNLIVIEYYSIKLKDNVYMPYIAKNKCQQVRGKKNLYNNGRIMQAEYVLMTITDIDYHIIESQYDYQDSHILELYLADMDFLNVEYRTFIYEMFKEKCKLETGDPYFYAKYKNMINSLFGMMLTDITREEITYHDYEWSNELRPVQDLLDEYYRKYSSFLSYQHGIYVTAWARKELQDGFDIVGIDTVYGDTDSVKYMGVHDKDFALLNEKMREADISLDVPVVYSEGDKVWRLGEWEKDAHYKAFKTYGAKKYAYEYDTVKKGKHYGVTVAGLSKDKGAEYLETHGGLQAFKEGTVFDTDYSGRMTAKYNIHKGITPYVYKGHEVEITSNVCLLETTYTLGIGNEYADFLDGVRGKKEI